MESNTDSMSPLNLNTTYCNQNFTEEQLTYNTGKHSFPSSSTDEKLPSFTLLNPDWDEYR